jgi:hypothetical protein
MLDSIEFSYKYVNVELSMCHRFSKPRRFKIYTEGYPFLSFSANEFAGTGANKFANT